jgi:predicted TPR repeat methyltransferase
MTDRFAELAATWDDHPTPTAIATDFAAFISRQGLSADAEVIDYGCGTGLLGLRIAEQASHLHGMDNSPKMLDVFRQKAETLNVDNVALSTHRFGRDPLPEAACTLMVSSMVLHHIEDVPAFFQAAFATIKPGGACAFADLDTEDGTFHPPHAEGVHHHGFDREVIIGWLRDAGFETPTMETVHTLTREDRSYPIFGLIARRP